MQQRIRLHGDQLELALGDQLALAAPPPTGDQLARAPPPPTGDQLVLARPPPPGDQLTLAPKVLDDTELDELMEEACKVHPVKPIEWDQQRKNAPKDKMAKKKAEQTAKERQREESHV